MIVYFNGDFLPKEGVRVSPDDRGFLFGDGVYEVVRALDGVIFRAEAHWQRLRRSQEAVQIAGLNAVEFQAIAETLLKKNNLRNGEATVYLQITRGVAQRRHNYPQPPVAPTVYGFAAALSPKRENWETGVHILLVPDQRGERCDIKSTCLLPNVMASQQAHAAGAYEAVLVREGFLTEGSHSNFVGVRDETLITHPANHRILAGITRQVVFELCSKLNIPVRESAIPESELQSLDEAILLGTTTDVMPVVRVNDWQIADGLPGRMTRHLQKAFLELVTDERAARGNIGRL